MFDRDTMTESGFIHVLTDFLEWLEKEHNIRLLELRENQRDGKHYVPLSNQRLIDSYSRYRMHLSKKLATLDELRKME